MADAARRAARELRVLAVAALVVGGLAVAEHGHDVGEDDAGSVVLVGVHEDAESVKVVRVTKDVTLLATLAGHPHGEAIAV